MLNVLLDVTKLILTLFQALVDAGRTVGGTVGMRKAAGRVMLQVHLSVVVLCE